MRLSQAIRRLRSSCRGVARHAWTPFDTGDDWTHEMAEVEWLRPENGSEAGSRPGPLEDCFGCACSTCCDCPDCPEPCEECA